MLGNVRNLEVLEPRFPVIHIDKVLEILGWLDLKFDWKFVLAGSSAFWSASLCVARLSASSSFVSFHLPFLKYGFFRTALAVFQSGDYIVYIRDLYFCFGCHGILFITLLV